MGVSPRTVFPFSHKLKGNTTTPKKGGNETGGVEGRGRERKMGDFC